MRTWPQIKSRLYICQHQLKIKFTNENFAQQGLDIRILKFNLRPYTVEQNWRTKKLATFSKFIFSHVIYQFTKYQPGLQRVPWWLGRSNCGANRNWVWAWVGPGCENPVRPRNRLPRKVWPKRGKLCGAVLRIFFGSNGRSYIAGPLKETFYLFRNSTDFFYTCVPE